MGKEGPRTTNGLGHCLFQIESILLTLVFAANLLQQLVQAGPLNFECDPCIDRSKLEIHALVHGTADDPFWQQSEKSMRQAAKDMGVEFHMNLWETFSSQAMADEILRLIHYEFDDSPHGHTHNVKQIDGLIVTIPDDIVKAAVQDAVNAGIHVFGLNMGYQYAKEAGLMGHVAQDEYVAGQMAAMEFERRRLDAHGPAQRALFVNHNEDDPALHERYRGYKDYLTSGFGIEVDQVIVDPEETYGMIIELHENIASCSYDFVLLGGTETLSAVTDAFGHHKCNLPPATAEGQSAKDSSLNETSIRRRNYAALTDSSTTVTRQERAGPMMIGAFDGTRDAFDAIVAERLEFALSQEIYLQSALPVVLVSLYASTGKLLRRTSEEPVFISGPHVHSITNIPSDTYLDCVEEAFPVCQNDNTQTFGECPCVDRGRLRIAGVVHGVVGDAFWDTIIHAAEQASLDMNVNLELELFQPQESDAVLHKKMASKIKSLCGSGVDGIFVSMPSEALVEAVRFCKQLRVPVVNINAGHKLAVELGVQHIGQLEEASGKEAGDRMLVANVEEGYCLVPEAGNSALLERCRGFQEVLESSNKTYGGLVEVPWDRLAQYTQIVETEVGDPEGNWKGIGLLVNGDINPALKLQRRHQAVVLGTFDIREDLFEPLDDGRLLFTIDQQQYLQGSMPIFLLAYAAYTNQELINPVIETGPKLVQYAPSPEQRTCERNGFYACTKIPEEDYSYISEIWLIWGYSAVALVCFVSLISLLWMHRYRNKNIVKASQPLFLMLIVVGAAVSTLSILPQGVQTAYRYLKDPMTGELTDEPNPDIMFVDLMCMLAPWMYGVGFSIIFSALCAKIHRVKMIYAAGVAMRRKKVNVRDVVSIMAFILSLEVTILLCWTLISPSRWEREPTQEVDGYVLQSVGGCSSEHHSTFLLAQVLLHAACLAYAVLLCWQTSEIPTEFAEGSYISLSVLCIFQVSVLTIPIAYMVEDSPDVYYFVKCASIFLQNFTVLSLIFIPKMWRVFSGNDQVPLPRVTTRTQGRGSSAPTFHTNGADGQPTSSSVVVPVATSQFSKPSSIDASLRIAAASKKSTDFTGVQCNGASNFVSAQTMAPLDSVSDGDDSKSELVEKDARIAGAFHHLQAGLDDSNSSSSASVVDPPAHETKIVGADDELAHLAAEISKVERVRAMVVTSFADNDGSSAVGNQQSKSASVEHKIPKRSNSNSRKEFKRQDSPDVDSSVESSSRNDTADDQQATMPLHLNIEIKKLNAPTNTDRSDVPKPRHSGSRNPQEDSHASCDNSKDKKELSSLESERHAESESISSAGPSTKIAASKAEIFRRPSEQSPHSRTPIRLKKEPEDYGESAALAMGISKAKGSFLRKVAVSFGTTSGSVASSKHLEASFESESERDLGPQNGKLVAAVPESHGDVGSCEFEVLHKRRPQYAAMKHSAPRDEEVLTPTTFEESTDGDGFYFL